MHLAPPSFEILNADTILNSDLSKMVNLDYEYKLEDNVITDIKKFESILDLIQPKKALENPKWITENRNFRQDDYVNFLATQLRARYTEISADFRTIFYDYVRGEEDESLEVKMGTASEIVYLLTIARSILEKQELNKQELFLATNQLDLAEECMVWLYSPELAKAGIPSMYSLLDESNPKYKEEYKKKLDELDKEDEPLDKLKFRPIFDEIIAACNDCNLDKMINIGLQIERLKYFQMLGSGLFLILLIAFPLILNVGIFKTWSLQENSTSIYNLISFTGIHINKYSVNQPLNYWLISLIAALGFAIVGGVGGYVSGLIQTRSSKTNLGLYEESVLLSKLRIIFGAIAALVSFSLLSWNLLPGLLNNSPGTYVMTAFLSGFSERYLLNLIKSEEPESGKVG